MSVCIADDAHYITTPSSRLHLSNVVDCTPQHPQDETTYVKAIRKIQKEVKNVSDRFNIRPDELEAAYKLLDKEDRHKLMRVTYSDDFNFIIRYMPSPVHEEAHRNWSHALFVALTLLTAPPHAEIAPRCKDIGSTTYQVGPKRKEADSGVRPTHSNVPSIVLEVGDSESLTQLKTDARLWLEHIPAIQLVILMSIDPPRPPNPNLPRITVQLWRGFPPIHAPHLPTGQQTARMVWEADWTQAATPLYIFLSDIFRGPAPTAYGNNDRVHLDTRAWRQDIIDAWLLLYCTISINSDVMRNARPLRSKILPM